jgi:pimeloyl-ACP methyl ester carboxylesterase
MAAERISKIYCLSGLGADKRIFHHIEIPGIVLVHLEWLQPLQKNETIHQYAIRLSGFIEDENPVLIGVSFGGMMAIEIAKYIPVRAVILVSSIKSTSELPRWMKILGKCHAEYLLPRVPLKSIGPLRLIRPLQNYFLGASTGEEIAIANEFRDNVDPRYLKWSIRQIFNWNNSWLPEKLFHIHGDNDKLFPLKYIKPSHIIHHGGHFMIMSQCREVSRAIREICDEIRKESENSVKMAM